MILIKILFYLFPYTGLGYIVFFPFIFLTNTIFLILVYYKLKTSNAQRLVFKWLFANMCMTLFTIFTFPQEFRPNVAKQLYFSIKSIKNYPHSTFSDIELPYNVENYSSDNCQILDSKERYIVALYKYQNKIKSKDTSISNFTMKNESDVNSKINEQNSKIIVEHFKTGQEKLMWWTLEILYP